ncbi:MHC class I alpha chain, partial [Clarias magur]
YRGRWRTILLMLLLFITRIAYFSSADTHSLQFFYTGVTPGINFPEFTAVALVDGEQSEYYDSTIRKAIPKTEWIKEIDVDDPDFWNSETKIWQEEQEWIKADVDRLMKYWNQSEGVHSVQFMFGCELDDDGTTRAHSQWAYDGEDFISLDLKMETWTATNIRALIAQNSWNPTGHDANYCVFYLRTECIFFLKKFTSYGKMILERKVRPAVSVFQKHSSPSPEVVCHATGFFPKALNITWQKDGEDVHEDVELRETLPNQDGSFQKRSILKVPAERLQKHTYTCVVQHSSLEKELVREVPKGGAPIAIITAVVAALVTIVGGIVFWKKKNSAFRPVPPKP